MSTNDIKVLKAGGEVRTYKVDDRTTSGYGMTIKAGEPVTSTPNYVARVQTGQPNVGAYDGLMVGIAVDESTETSTANGTVNVQTILPGQTVWQGVATTKGNVDTASELLAYLGNYIRFDASNVITSTSASVITIDEDDTNDPNKNGLILIDGSADARGLLDVIVHINCTEMGALVGQTID